jgi:hypothetical protein
VIDALLSLSYRVKAGQGVSTRFRSCPAPLSLTHYPAFPLEPKVTSLALRQGGVTGGWSCLALPGQYMCCRTLRGLRMVPSARGRPSQPGFADECVPIVPHPRHTQAASSANYCASAHHTADR